jgi:hypothetical protein
MNKPEFKLPNFWSEEQAHPVLLLNRGAERRKQQREIIVETLRLIKGQPTGRELQTFSKLRRKVFLPLLKSLVKSSILERTGSGTRGSPFRYRLSDQNHF